MSFWDVIISVAQYIVSVPQKKMESINKAKERYKDLDDQELIRKYKCSSGDNKMACALLLKERGYTSTDND